MSNIKELKAQHEEAETHCLASQQSIAESQKRLDETLSQRVEIRHMCEKY